MPRPNVAPRPACRYFATPRGCFAGARCHYLHADPTYAPYELNKTCRFFARGFCKRGAACWFAHDAAAAKPEPEPAAETETETDAGAGAESDAETLTEPEPEPEPCGICFDEHPALYGLLSGCSHAFCLACIRQWRDPEGKGTDMQEAATHKTCPMCRNMTAFITPSSLFFAQGDPRKHAATAQYKQSMARVPCRYFARSPPAARFCPFGRDCFYAHRTADGAPHVFADGVDAMMPQWRHRRAEHDARTERAEHEELLAAVAAVMAAAEEDGEEQEEGEEQVQVQVQDAVPMPVRPVPVLAADAPSRLRSRSPSPSPSPSLSLAPSRAPAPAPAPTVTVTDDARARMDDDDPRTGGGAGREGLLRGDFAWMMMHDADACADE